MTSEDAEAGAISGPEMPLLQWDEIYQKVMLSPRRRPSLMYDNPLAVSQINSILSASSYPFPEQNAPVQFEPDENAPPQLYGGLLIQNASRESSQGIALDQSIPDTHLQPLPKKAKRSRDELPATKPSSKKRGRPRKTLEGSTGEDPEERRRMQIRLAQRAYRSRKEASIASFKSRIAMLESAVEKMSASILSFSDELVQSGALESHPDLTGPLRDTVGTCLTLAKEAEDGRQDVLETSPRSDESGPLVAGGQPNQSPSDEFKAPWMSNSVPINQAYSQWEPTSPSSAPDLSDLSDMEVSAFIERLHFACIYQGNLALGDPSIPTSRLEEPFRLLFTITDRKRLQSFFEAALYARVSQKRLEEWKDIPFFCLGGAGTHYPRPASANTKAGPPLHPYRQWTMVHNPLARLPSSVQEQLEGDWFDIKDLEGYLREKGVHLRATPPVHSKARSPTQDTINVARLLPALMNKAICLGRTPGFRRHDVDSALLSAVWT